MKSDLLLYVICVAAVAALLIQLGWMVYVEKQRDAYCAEHTQDTRCAGRWR